MALAQYGSYSAKGFTIRCQHPALGLRRPDPAWDFVDRGLLVSYNR